MAFHIPERVPQVHRVRTVRSRFEMQSKWLTRHLHEVHELVYFQECHERVEHVRQGI